MNKIIFRQFCKQLLYEETRPKLCSTYKITPRRYYGHGKKKPFLQTHTKMKHGSNIVKSNKLKPGTFRKQINSFLSYLLWRRMASPLIELIVPSLIQKQTLADIGSFRNYQNLNICNEGNPIVKCHEQPKDFDIGEDLELDFSDRNVFEDFDCRKSSKRKKHTISPPVSVCSKTKNKNFLFNELSLIKKRFFAKLGKILSNTSHDNKFQDVTDFREYKDNVGIQFSYSGETVPIHQGGTAIMESEVSKVFPKERVTLLRPSLIETDLYPNVENQTPLRERKTLKTLNNNTKNQHDQSKKKLNQKSQKVHSKINNFKSTDSNKVDRSKSNYLSSPENKRSLASNINKISSRAVKGTSKTKLKLPNEVNVLPKHNKIQGGTIKRKVRKISSRKSSVVRALERNPTIDVSTKITPTPYKLDKPFRSQEYQDNTKNLSSSQQQPTKCPSVTDVKEEVVIRSNLVVFDTDGEGGKLLVKEQNLGLGKGLEGNLINLTHVLKEEEARFKSFQKNKEQTFDNKVQNKNKINSVLKPWRRVKEHFETKGGVNNIVSNVPIPTKQTNISSKSTDWTNPNKNVHNTLAEKNMMRKNNEESSIEIKTNALSNNNPSNTKVNIEKHDKLRETQKNLHNEMCPLVEGSSQGVSKSNVLLSEKENVSTLINNKKQVTNLDSCNVGSKLHLKSSTDMSKTKYQLKRSTETSFENENTDSNAKHNLKINENLKSNHSSIIKNDKSLDKKSNTNTTNTNQSSLKLSKLSDLKDGQEPNSMVKTTHITKSSENEKPLGVIAIKNTNSGKIEEKNSKMLSMQNNELKEKKVLIKDENDKTSIKSRKENIANSNELMKTQSMVRFAAEKNVKKYPKGKMSIKKSKSLPSNAKSSVSEKEHINNIDSTTTDGYEKKTNKKPVETKYLKINSKVSTDKTKATLRFETEKPIPDKAMLTMKRNSNQIQRSLSETNSGSQKTVNQDSQMLNSKGHLNVKINSSPVQNPKESKLNQQTNSIQTKSSHKTRNLSIDQPKQFDTKKNVDAQNEQKNVKNIYPGIKVKSNQINNKEKTIKTKMPKDHKPTETMLTEAKIQTKENPPTNNAKNINEMKVSNSGSKSSISHSKVPVTKNNIGQNLDVVQNNESNQIHDSKKFQSKIAVSSTTNVSTKHITEHNMKIDKNKDIQNLTSRQTTVSESKVELKNKRSNSPLRHVNPVSSEIAPEKKASKQKMTKLQNSLLVTGLKPNSVKLKRKVKSQEVMKKDRLKHSLFGQNLTSSKSQQKMNNRKTLEPKKTSETSLNTHVQKHKLKLGNLSQKITSSVALKEEHFADGLKQKTISVLDKIRSQEVSKKKHHSETHLNTIKYLNPQPQLLSENKKQSPAKTVNDNSNGTKDSITHNTKINVKKTTENSTNNSVKKDFNMINRGKVAKQKKVKNAYDMRLNDQKDEKVIELRNVKNKIK